MFNAPTCGDVIGIVIWAIIMIIAIVWGVTKERRDQNKRMRDPYRHCHGPNFE